MDDEDKLIELPKAILLNIFEELNGTPMEDETDKDILVPSISYIY